MIDNLILDYQAKIQSRLDILVSETGQIYDNVVKAERYSLLNSGKRVRPIMLLEFYRLCGGNDDCAYNFAAAIEMIHTYSLIHDDMPCMDDDDMRRGKPSCHKKFGEATALLAGDSLLTDAFNVASKTLGIPSDRVIKSIQILSSCAGVPGMIGGQVVDLMSENKTISVGTLTEMYRLKTGALIKAACVIGCILAGAENSVQSMAAKFAENVGIAFQIIDDILDVTGDESQLGKPVGSDAENRKNTYVSLVGTEESRRAAKQYTDEAIQSLEAIPGDKAVLKEITEALLLRKY